MSITRTATDQQGYGIVIYQPFINVSVRNVLMAEKYHIQGRDENLVGNCRRMLEVPNWVFGGVVQHIYSCDAHSEFDGRNRIKRVWHREGERDIRVEYESDDECLERLYKSHLQQHWTTLSIKEKELALVSVGINASSDRPTKESLSRPRAVKPSTRKKRNIDL